MKYLQVTISAEDKKQAEDILTTLISQKLVTGGQMIQAPARFLWKGEVTDMDYVTITSFTTEKHKKEIMEIVDAISYEEVPMITFTPFEGNEKLLKYIDKTVG